MIVEPSSTITINKEEKKTQMFFPDEIFVHLFSYLNFLELMAAESTCRRWRSAASDPLLWKARYLKFSHDWCPEEEPKSWKVLIKRTFYLKRCMSDHQNCLGEIKQSPMFDSRRKRLQSKIDHFSYLESADITRYVLYTLCGGPQFYYQLPVSDGIYDPSIFRKSGECYKISRDPDDDIIRYSYALKQEQHTTFGVSKVYFSTEKKGVVCEFTPYLRGLPRRTWTLTQNGVIPNQETFNSTQKFIQSKIREQLEITDPNPALSDPEEATHDR